MPRFQLTPFTLSAALTFALWSGACGNSGGSQSSVVTPSPTPTAQPSPTPTAQPTPTALPTPSPSPSPSPTPAPIAPPPEQATSADQVYQPADAQLVAAGRPGDLISYFPQQLVLLNSQAWIVLYRSTSAIGHRIAVSGTVLVPRAAWTGSGPRPILAFAHETVGITDDCAPSRTITSGAYPELSHVSQALAKGWAVALTDYEGLGTPGRHTYTVNVAEARAVLDSVRAALQVPGAGLDARAPVAIWGYSQGGGAAAAAAEAAPTYAPELDWRGVAAGGTTADLTAIAKAGEGTMYYGFVSAGSAGLDAAYPELDLRSYLNATGQASYDAIDTKSACMATLLVDYAFRRDSDYCTSDPRDAPAWQRRLGENLVGRVGIEMPAFLYHGTYDDVIPLAVGAGLRDRWCALGATVQWKQYPDLVLGHVSTKGSAAPDALRWLADRFAGTPAPTSCE